MIELDEALAIVARAANPLGRERVELAQAHGRVLAEPVVAMVDWPPADVSAMDGYAVRSDDPSPLRVIGECFAGQAFDGSVGLGECVRIFTGATIPKGADRVEIQENATRDGDFVRFDAPPSSRTHVRRQGSDFRTGDTLLPAGRRIDARAIVAAAGADVARLELWRRPRVSIIGSGDELVAPGSARDRTGTIPESISFGVSAMVAQWGGETVGRSLLPDEPDRIRLAAKEATERSDVIVITGGASVGERDFSRAAMVGLGLHMLFAKVAIKPGKPVWFGRVGRTLVVGLPGNPVSAMVTARLFLAPLLVGLVGGDPASAVRWQVATLGAGLDACGDRETIVRARRTGPSVVALGNQDSAAQKSLVEANCLIRRRPGASASVAGDPVEVIDF